MSWEDAGDFCTTLFVAEGGQECEAPGNHGDATPHEHYPIVAGSRLWLTAYAWDERDPYNPVLQGWDGVRVSVHDDEESLAYARTQIAAICQLARETLA